VEVPCSEPELAFAEDPGADFDADLDTERPAIPTSEPTLRGKMRGSHANTFPVRLACPAGYPATCLAV
jgi:hypothetical protein